MKIVARIATILVILTCIGSVYYIKLLGEKRDYFRSEKARLEVVLEATSNKLVRTENTLRETQATLARTQEELAKANADLQATKVALEQKTQEAEGLKTQVAKLEEDLKKSQTELASAKDVIDKIQQALRDAGLSGISDIDAIRNKVTALTDENQVLGGQLLVMREENNQLSEKVVFLSTTPINLRGHVAAVQGNWNFLVLDVGHDQRVQTNTTFLVYRDSKMVAKVQVISVGATTSVAEVLPEYRKGTPRVGDLVVH